MQVEVVEQHLKDFRSGMANIAQALTFAAKYQCIFRLSGDEWDAVRELKRVMESFEGIAKDLRRD